MELLLGAGTNHRRKLSSPHAPFAYGWSKLVTVDKCAEYHPDLVWDLSSDKPLPFANCSFDEIHAYEVLEHLGRQGDWPTLARQFEDYWRLLKPDGIFCATVPCWRSLWAWGDPDHKRVINEGTLVFLSQKSYGEGGCGMTPMAEYPYHADFDLVSQSHTRDVSHDDCNFLFVLRAIK